jgi:hypothetical protein
LSPVGYLAAHPERPREVAALHYGEWPWPELGDSIDAREKLLSTCCRRGSIPLGVMALDLDDLCGFALLVRYASDLAGRWSNVVFITTATLQSWHIANTSNSDAMDKQFFM